MDLFCDLVSKEHAKSPRDRRAACNRLKGRTQQNQLRLANQSALRALSSWIDLSILDLTYLKDFKPEVPWVVEKLGIAPSIAQASFDRLQKVGLLEIDKQMGRWVDTSPLFTTTDGIPNDSIRRFHQSLLNLGAVIVRTESGTKSYESFRCTAFLVYP